MLGDPVVLGEITDPKVIKEMEERWERYSRNEAVFREKAHAIYQQYRGKVVVIAGQELHVADTVDEAWAWARQNHPDDDGLFTRLVPKERGWRIYGSSWRMVRV